jgi:uncharacterized coiled-coil protein SlyX
MENTAMPDSKKALDNLRGAIKSERLEVDARDAALRALADKMEAFQVGAGPAPTVEEFLQWRDSTVQRGLNRLDGQSEGAS